MDRLCDVCGEVIPANKRADSKVCSSYCRVKKYSQTDVGKRKAVEKTRRYQLTVKGKETKKKADKKYYLSHTEKWRTPELVERNKFCAAARGLMLKNKRIYSCIDCNRDNLKLDVHHIDERWWNNDLSNLEYRCKACHNRIHGKIPHTVPATDCRRKVPYTEEETLSYLREAHKLIDVLPFTQASYTKLGSGRPTVKTITKYKSWSEWMKLI